MNYIAKGKEKGTIFCIHGNSSSAKVYENLLNSSEIPNTKIAYDLIGHGNNQPKGLNLDHYSFDSQKEFLLQKISEIDDEILLIGNSIGGHLAIELANEISNLKGLVIMGTPPLKKPINFEEAFIPVPALNTFLTENPKINEIIDAFDIVIKDKSEKANMVADFEKANPLVRKVTAIDLMENKLSNQFTIFTKLTIPKYIISGDSDISVNRNYLDLVKSNCEYKCKIIDFENCGHYPTIDSPIKFIKTIKKIAEEIF